MLRGFHVGLPSMGLPGVGLPRVPTPNHFSRSIAIPHLLGPQLQHLQHHPLCLHVLPHLPLRLSPLSPALSSKTQYLNRILRFQGLQHRSLQLQRPRERGQLGCTIIWQEQPICKLCLRMMMEWRSSLASTVQKRVSRRSLWYLQGRRILRNT